MKNNLLSFLLLSIMALFLVIAPTESEAKRGRSYSTKGSSSKSYGRSKPVKVRSYTKKDGTKVKGHSRSLPKK
jgi:hypothetical protein